MEYFFVRYYSLIDDSEEVNVIEETLDAEQFQHLLDLERLGHCVIEEWYEDNE
jgi:hypothetical protein